MLDGLVPPLLVVALTAVGVWWSGRRRAAARRSAAFAHIAMLVAPVALTIGLEIAMGRALTYQHGPVRLWSGNINSDENSQQLFDPYTFTHVIHGAAFYGATRLMLGREAVMVRAIIAIGMEAAWEVYENTDQIINRYRTETLALGYYGDSVVNSVFDIIACGVGFALTRKLPTRLTLAWIAASEIILAVLIRDNLTLNIIMLVHPFDAIRQWQLGV